jgi:hypothetical protein
VSSGKSLCSSGKNGDAGGKLIVSSNDEGNHRTPKNKSQFHYDSAVTLRKKKNISPEKWSGLAGVVGGGGDLQGCARGAAVRAIYRYLMTRCEPVVSS